MEQSNPTILLIPNQSRISKLTHNGILRFTGLGLDDKNMAWCYAQAAGDEEAVRTLDSYYKDHMVDQAEVIDLDKLADRYGIEGGLTFEDENGQEALFYLGVSREHQSLISTDLHMLLGFELERSEDQIHYQVDIALAGVFAKINMAPPFPDQQVITRRLFTITKDGTRAVPDLPTTVLRPSCYVYKGNRIIE